MAWGSLARDVPRRNLRSFCFVSSEKVYSRASEDCGVVSSAAERGLSRLAMPLRISGERESSRG